MNNFLIFSINAIFLLFSVSITVRIARYIFHSHSLFGTP